MGMIIQLRDLRKGVENTGRSACCLGRTDIYAVKPLAVFSIFLMVH